MNRPTIVLLSFLASYSIEAALPQHSLSPSRQFIVYGAEPALRGSVSQLVEQTKTNLLALLHQPDEWKTPIVINLQPPQANVPETPPAELRFSQTGFGLKLQVDLTIAQKADASLVERELLRAILLEMIYRNEPDIAVGAVFVEPPEWLLDGVLTLTPGRERQRLIDALTVSAKVMPLGEFLQNSGRVSQLDSAGRLLYRAYAFALVQMLIDAPDGRSRLSRYIGRLSRATNDPLADLQAQFPMLRNNLEQTWKSSVTRLGATQEFHLLTVTKTENRLTELLHLKIPAADSSVKNSDLLELVRRRKRLRPEETVVLRQLSRELMVLATRANPVMRPVVREYQRIANILAAGKRQKLEQRLARLGSTREQLMTRMNDVDDYLNWFEATQIKANSETFTGYLKAASESPDLAPRRRDALSVYLDSLETQF